MIAPGGAPQGLADLMPLGHGAQAEIARAAGLRRAYLCDIIAGRRPLTLEVAFRIARALGIAPSRLDDRLTDRLN